MSLITVKDYICTHFEFSELYPAEHLLNVLNVKDAFFAGGYFRDQLNGVEFKDVDIFIPGFEPMDDMCDDELRYNVASASEFTIGGVRYNAISLRNKLDLETTLRRMDIGLCQIGMTNRHEIVATQAYLDDVANKTLTILQQPRSDADQDHIKRVQAKYPAHQLVYACT